VYAIRINIQEEVWIMRYDLYCDESRQDLLVNKKSIHENNRFVCIGGIMLPLEYREIVKSAIKELINKYKVYGEIKWGSVSDNKLKFYIELIDTFFGFGNEIEFRTVIIDAYEVDNETFNESDHELGYYKFYYQLIYNWICKNNNYYVFTDYKTNKGRYRLQNLKDIINRVNNCNCVKLKLT
jgi:hypothetical protein